jgi:hypothetical protein
MLVGCAAPLPRFSATCNCVTWRDGSILVCSLDGMAQLVLDPHCLVVKLVLRLPLSYRFDAPTQSTTRQEGSARGGGDGGGDDDDDGDYGSHGHQRQHRPYQRHDDQSRHHRHHHHYGGDHSGSRSLPDAVELVQMFPVFGVPPRYHPLLRLAFAYQLRRREHHALLSFLRLKNSSSSPLSSSSLPWTPSTSSSSPSSFSSCYYSSSPRVRLYTSAAAAVARRANDDDVDDDDDDDDDDSDGGGGGSGGDCSNGGVVATGFGAFVSGAAPSLEHGRRCVQENAAAVGHLVDPARCVCHVLQLPVYRAPPPGTTSWKTAQESLSSQSSFPSSTSSSMGMCNPHEARRDLAWSCVHNGAEAARESAWAGLDPAQDDQDQACDGGSGDADLQHKHHDHRHYDDDHDHDHASRRDRQPTGVHNRFFSPAWSNRTRAQPSPPRPPPPPPQPQPTPPPLLPPRREHLRREGGFAFAYPPDQVVAVEATDAATFYFLGGDSRAAFERDETPLVQVVLHKDHSVCLLTRGEFVFYYTNTAPRGTDSTTTSSSSGSSGVSGSSSSSSNNNNNSGGAGGGGGDLTSGRDGGTASAKATVPAVIGNLTSNDDVSLESMPLPVDREHFGIPAEVFTISAAPLVVGGAPVAAGASLGGDAEGGGAGGGRRGDTARQTTVHAHERHILPRVLFHARMLMEHNLRVLRGRVWTRFGPASSSAPGAAAAAAAAVPSAKTVAGGTPPWAVAAAAAAEAHMTRVRSGSAAVVDQFESSPHTVVFAPSATAAETITTTTTAATTTSGSGKGKLRVVAPGKFSAEVVVEQDLPQHG